MCQVTDWERVIDFHGHVCVGLAAGYRAALAALRALGADPAADEELVAIVENDACGVDALQVLTGCTLGKGNLIFRDWGKPVYTVARRDNGKAVRVVMKDTSWAVDEELAALRRKVFAGEGTPEDRRRFQARQMEAAERILNAPEEEVCTVEEVSIDLPPKARIFPSVTCACCGERVMEPRARLVEGKTLCIPCSGQAD
ncbi:MAG: FmdE family protein [Bacillota bacterium]